MKTNNGFTLIELLAVIVILAIVLAIAVPSISKIVDNIRIQAFIDNEEMLVRAAKKMVGIDDNYLPKVIGETKEVKLSELQASKYIGAIVSPSDKNKECNGYVLITKINNDKYEYTPQLNCINDIGSLTEDGLVAHYTFDDIQEGTQNVVTNTNLNTGWSQGYQTNIVFNEVSPPLGIDSPTVGFNRGNSSGYWYSYGDYAPQEPGQTYTVSLYVKTLDSNFRINFYTADNSEVGRYWSEYKTVPNDGKWHRIVWNSFTNGVDSQSDSLSFNFSYAGAIGDPNTRTWFSAPQMEPKSNVTPFVIGTRETVTKDYSSNENHAVIKGATQTLNRFGEDNKALKFNGSSNYVQIKDNITLDLTDNMTVSAWVKLDAQSYYGLVHKGDSTIKGAGLSYGFNDNGFMFISWNGSNSPYDIRRLTDIGHWHYLVGVVENNIRSLYIDGKYINSSDSSISSWNNDRDLIIGASGNIGNYMKGSIDDVRIYNRPLTETEIKYNYDIESKVSR